MQETEKGEFDWYRKMASTILRTTTTPGLLQSHSIPITPASPMPQPNIQSNAWQSSQRRQLRPVALLITSWSLVQPVRTRHPGSKVPSCADIIWKVANHKALGCREIMLNCRVFIEQDIRFLAWERFGAAMGVKIRANNIRALCFQVCRESSKPSLEVRH